MAIQKVTKETFEKEVLQSEVPVLVDFFAGWCSPCRALSQILDEVDSEGGFKKIVKIDIDEQEELASQYKIMSVPTLLLFKNGELVEKSIGLVQKDEIKALLSK